MAIELEFITVKCENCPRTLMSIKNIKEGLISKDCSKCGHKNIIVISDYKISNPKKTKEQG